MKRNDKTSLIRYLYSRYCPGSLSGGREGNSGSAAIRKDSKKDEKTIN
jgi:hypothetical protein